MRGWEKVSDRQSEVVRFLVNSYHKNRLVHAYILEGAKGVLKCYCVNQRIRFVERVEVVR